MEVPKLKPKKSLIVDLNASNVDGDDNNTEPNIVLEVSPLLSPSSSTGRSRVHSLSDVFHNKKASQLTEAITKEMQSSSAFPDKYQHSGYLCVKTEENNQWQQQYFVLSNNFLFGADTKYSTKLSICIPLESTMYAQSSDMIFDINKYQFRANSPQLCKEWLANIEKASNLTIYDIYRFRFQLGIIHTHNQQNIKNAQSIQKQLRKLCLL